MADKFVAGAALAGLAGGTFLTGLALSALHLNPVQITLSSSSELIASLVGALVGGALSIAGTYAFQRSERSRADKAAAYVLVTEVATLHTELINLLDYIQQAVKPHALAGLAPKDYWTVVFPHASMYSQRTLSQPGLAVLVGGGEFDLHTDLVRLEAAHREIADAWKLYVETRRELGALIPISAIDGARFRSEFDPLKHPEAAVKIVELQTLLPSILDGAAARAKFSTETVAKIGPTFKRLFKARTFPSIQVVELRPTG